MRTEGKVIDEIRAGKYDASKDRCTSGAFATWARGVLNQFALKDRLVTAIRNKMSSADYCEQEYAFRFFAHYLPGLEPKPSASTVSVIRKGLKAGDKRFHSFVGCYNNEMFGSAEWFTPFKEAYEQFEEKQLWTGTTDDDDVPF
jgi:hypothetical protein